MAPRSHGLRFIMIAAVLIVGALWILEPANLWPLPHNQPAESKRVPLEAHIM